MLDFVRIGDWQDRGNSLHIIPPYPLVRYMYYNKCEEMTYFGKQVKKKSLILVYL